MCGIAGALLVPGGALTGEQLRSASERLAHRGPDDLGFLGWNGNGPARVGREASIGAGARVGMVHRRLAILDLSSAGWQPMVSHDGRAFIVFNGEIYNFRELRTELEQLGDRFFSQSDTEVLLAAYRRWGKAALTRLIGMFAFAILDTQTRKLFLARDCFGIKPLYYAAFEQGFAFASEIKSLIALTGLKPRAHPQRLYQYLLFGLTDHGGETLFQQVRQLPAAHWMEISVDQPAASEPVRYWDLDLSARAELSFDQAADRLRELFLESVQLHLRSDVPLGAALSGGIDSSAIVMAMRHLCGAGLELHTFSYEADDPALSESSWIALAGRAAGAILHRTTPAPNQLSTDLERLIAVQDEPFGSTSIYAQHRVFGLAQAAGIKVMLDGQGADELLAGYRIFYATRLAGLFRRGRWAEAARLLQRIARLPGCPSREVIQSLGSKLLPGGLRSLARHWVGKDLAPAWLHANWFRERGVDCVSPWQKSVNGTLPEHLYEAITNSSLPMLLRYEDRNSMAYSIESRVPFLVPELARFVLSLPEEYIIDSDGMTKAILRRALRGMVPAAILERRDKIGFATPERSWLVRLGDWVEQVLSAHSPASQSILRREELLREWREVVAGRRDYDLHIWRWINLIRWAQRFEISFHE